MILFVIYNEKSQDYILSHLFFEGLKKKKHFR